MKSKKSKKFSLRGKTKLITPFEPYKGGSKKKVVGMHPGFRVRKKGKKKIADTIDMKETVRRVLKNLGEQNVEAIFIRGGASDYVKGIDTRADKKKTYKDIDYVVITKRKTNPEKEQAIKAPCWIYSKKSLFKDTISNFETRLDLLDSIPIYEKERGSSHKIIKNIEKNLSIEHEISTTSKDFEELKESIRKHRRTRRELLVN